MGTRPGTKRFAAALSAWAHVALVALSISVASAMPVVDLSRTSLALQGSAGQTVYLTNIGTEDLVIGSIAITGSFASKYLLGGVCANGTTLRPGERCTIEVFLFAPSVYGNWVAALVLTTNAGTNDTIALRQATDTCIETVPAYPGNIDFGPQPVGTASPTLTFKVACLNGEYFSLIPETITVGGKHPGDFPMTTDCVNGFHYQPGVTCSISVQFKPSANGPRAAEVYVKQKDQYVAALPVPFAIPLTGVGGSVGPPATADVVEYYNAALDHYFITWVAGEIAILDAGAAIKGWVRTGKTFKTYPIAQAGTTPVCRYYIPPDKGDSHFFGRGTVECNATGQMNPSFVLEDAQFMQMFLPNLGNCPTNTTPIYRVFSNRPDANHRYMTDKAARDQMMGMHWLAEGDGPDLVVMCAPQ